MLRFRNQLLPLLRAASQPPSPIHPRACHLLLSTSTSPTAFSLDEYLVAACGLAPAKAREVSKKASHEISREGSKKPLDQISYYARLHSASNPDAILALLSGAGLSRADIAAVVSADPLLLRASVKNIGPRLLALRERVGLSAPEIARFLLVASRVFRHGDAIPKLEFFISFYGSFEQVLVVAKRCTSFLSLGLERTEHNIALLRQWGVPDIAKLCSANPWLLTFNPERVNECLLRTEQLGLPPTSQMFRRALAVLSCVSKEKLDAKIEFFKRTLGWSESEVSSAVSRNPSIVAFTDENLLCKIEFLVNEAGMEPRNILERPDLLQYSLQKRLVPRNYVMKVLQEKGLMSSNIGFMRFLNIGEETFKSRFINCHKDPVPGLADAYAAGFAGSVPCIV